MEISKNLNNPIDNESNDFKIINNQEQLIDHDDAEFMAAFAARALQKTKVRERMEQDQKHSESQVPYKQQRKKLEQDLGQVGTSKINLREKTTDRQFIEQDFRDSGINNLDAFMNELNGTERYGRPALSPERVFDKFHDLFVFLGEETEGNPNIIKEYQQITNKKEQLKFILSSSLSDKVRLFYSESFDYPNYDNFIQRLQFQQNFINGSAKIWQQEWDSDREEFINILKTLDPSEANIDNILLGLNRASLKSAMIGTPEYGAYKMALDIKKDRGWWTSPDFPQIRGYESNISNTDIGSWRVIIDEYNAIAEKVARANPDLDKDRLEHKTVRKAAKIFADSMNYNSAGRSPDSSYVSFFHESIAWAQLGHGVQRQLRGMRQKIDGIELSNIGRFIGMSGDSPKRISFEDERSRLNGRVNYINGLTDNDKRKFLAKENLFEIKKQEEWQEKEIARINHKYKKLIDKTRSEERRNTYASRQEEEIQRVIEDASGQIEYFRNRTLDELFSDIDNRQKLLSRRIEKRKSLAEKAIDLHFNLGGGSAKWDEDLGKYVKNSKYLYCLDWINTAPFGVIKRAHKRMNDGMSADEIYRLAISEIITKAVNNPTQAQINLNQIFKNVGYEYSDLYDFSRIIALATKLSKYSKELTYSELEFMASKQIRGLKEALAAFSFSDVKQFIAKNLDLRLVPKLSRVAREFGYELSADQLINISSKKTINSHSIEEAEQTLASILRTFSPEEVASTMDANADLEILSAIRSVLPSRGVSDFSELIDRAIKVERNSSKHEDDNYKNTIHEYCTAIDSIGLEKADILLSSDVNLDVFNMASIEFKDSLRGNFDETIALSKNIQKAMALKGSRSSELEKEAIQKLRNSDVNYSESQILTLYNHGVAADLYCDLFITEEFNGDHTEIKETSKLSLNDKIKLIQDALNSPRNNRGRIDWNLRRSIESFDDDMLHKIVENNADVIQACYVKRSLQRNRELQEFNTPEGIIYLTLNYIDPNRILHATKAGFSLDEIKLYPFLASNLLTTERNEEDDDDIY